MKSIQLFASVLLCMVCFSCKKKEMLAPTEILLENVDTSAILKFSGNFSSGPYGTTVGAAEIYEKAGAYSIKLVDFRTTNGPALHVFISKEAMPINYIDVSELKSINGNQLYTVNGSPDFTDYKYISIHCVEYNHLFGSAILK